MLLTSTERHPVITMLTGALRYHAAAMRSAAVEYEKVLAVTPDNDKLLDDIATIFALATTNLSMAISNYRDTRDIQGVG